MIVTGTSPPYKHDYKTFRQPSWELSKFRVNLGDESNTFNFKGGTPPKSVERQRPKSSPLKISERILKNFNVDHTGAGLVFNLTKNGRNSQRTMEGTIRKGRCFKMVQPGYLMTKRKDGINVTLNMEELCANANKEKMKSSLHGERVPTLKALQREIDNLNETLTEERISHRSQFKQFIENTKVDVQVMLQEHRDHIKSIEEDHEEEIEKLTDMYETRLMERKAKADLDAARLQEEMNAVRKNLESCKEDVVSEMNETWREEKKQLAAENMLRTEELLDQQKLTMEQLKADELSKRNQDHDQEMKKLTEEHHKEMNAVLEKFVTCAEDAEKLKVALSERDKLKQEVDELRELYSDIKKQLKKTQNELADAKVTLQGYELSFSEKVAEVEERYAMKIHGLMLNNSDIRRNYMKKCSELLDVQSKTEIAQKESTKTAKTKMKTIILARTKADIILPTSTEKDKRTSTTPPQQTSRPKSAPTIKPTTLLRDASEPETTQYRPNSSLV